MATRIVDHLAAEPAPAPSLGARDLSVVFFKASAFEFWEYHGTRAQLEAEGVIPKGSAWPKGDGRLDWEDARFRWSLRRTRPEGLKGPKKLWVGGDWWALRCDVLDRLDRVAARRIAEKKAELAAEIHRQSAAGQRETMARVERVFKAQRDRAFQVFKSAIPGLVAPRRARKPKAAEQ
ncbi:MAG: hypothetical protein V9G29_00760 [Burkholderiaceae bacterium]